MSGHQTAKCTVFTRKLGLYVDVSSAKREAVKIHLTNLQAYATEGIRLCLRGVVWEMSDSISPCPRECDAKGRISSSASSPSLGCIHSVAEDVEFRVQFNKMP